MSAVTAKAKSFLNYIHYFRGAAIVFIVAVHTVISLPWHNQEIRKAFYTITSNGTVLFVFIAGFLFYYLSHNKFSYTNYLSKKLKYVILPYLIVSIPAIIDKLYFDDGNHWWMTENYDQLPVIGKIAYMIITGKQSGVLWFIPMITLFYLLSYPLIKYAKTKAFDYTAPLICILGFFTVQFGYRSTIIASLIHFMPVYLIGMWTCKVKEHLFKYQYPILACTTAAYIIMTYLELEEIIPFSYYMELRDSRTEFFVFNISKIKAVILCFVFLLAFKKYNERESRILTLLGDYSFGIFFLHLYIINVFQIMHTHGWLPVNKLTIFTFIIYLIAVLTSSLLIVFITKKVFGKNSRMILGS